MLLRDEQGPLFWNKDSQLVLMQLLRRRTRTGVVSRWISEEACFYSTAVVRAAIELRARRRGLVDGLR